MCGPSQQCSVHVSYLTHFCNCNEVRDLWLHKDLKFLLFVSHNSCIGIQAFYRNTWLCQYPRKGAKGCPIVLSCSYIFGWLHVLEVSPLKPPVAIWVATKLSPSPTFPSVKLTLPNWPFYWQIKYWQCVLNLVRRIPPLPNSCQSQQSPKV